MKEIFTKIKNYFVNILAKAKCIKLNSITIKIPFINITFAPWFFQQLSLECCFRLQHRDNTWDGPLCYERAVFLPASPFGRGGLAVDGKGDHRVVAKQRERKAMRA